MPFVRCRFYTESGEPVREGCRRRGAGCAFVHPGEPDWDNAPLPKPRDKSGDSGFKPWGRREFAPTSSAWDRGTNASTRATDTASGRERGADTGAGWGTGSGWGADESISAPNQAPESARSMNPLPTNPARTSTWGRAGTTLVQGSHEKNSENGWGGSANKTAGSGWGNAEDDAWKPTGWGEDSTDEDAPWSGSQAIGVGGGSGHKMDTNKDAGSTWGNARNDERGRGQENKDATNPWGGPDSMVVDSSAEVGSAQKEKRKSVPAPPRIRIPDNKDRKAEISGTNNEPLGAASKWGEPRVSNLPTVSTSATATPITMITPTDSTRLKRKRDATSDDKLDVFKEYVKAWERGVRARFLLLEAETKRDRWFRTQKSACYARIGEAGRKRLDGQRAECDKEVASQRDKLSAAITSLVAFHETLSTNLDLGQRYNIGEEAERFILESKAFVNEIHSLLVTQVLKDKNDVSDDTQKHPPPTNAALVDSLRNQIRDLEERFDHAQAELTLRHQRDIHSEIDERLTARIANLRMARQREIDHVASQPRPEIIIPPAALKKIEETAQQVRELDAKVPHTVEDIRLLLLRVDATTKRVDQLQEELSTNKETYTKIREMVAKKEEAVRTMDEQLERIRVQFQQLVASQPTNPASQPTILPTTCSSEDKLMESLRPAFEAHLDKFYEREIRPAIESMRQNVTGASARFQEEAIQVLWGRIQPAMNMVAEVSRWLDSQELVHTAPVWEDPSERCLQRLT